MNLLQAILMGIVQGLSEFLPISSSAHLVFTSNFYKVFKGLEIVQHTNEEVFFDIMVHLATLLAVIIYFFKDLKKIFIDFFIFQIPFHIVGRFAPPFCFVVFSF